MLQHLGARRFSELAERFRAAAGRIYSQHLASRGERVLFWIRHAVACLEPTPGLRRVTLDDLGLYLAQLQELSVGLARSDARLLLSIPFEGATDKQLESAQREDRFFRVSVLPTLPTGVPTEELSSWLKLSGLSYRPEDLEQMQGLSYDTLIQWLVQRYPELRAP